MDFEKKYIPINKGHFCLDTEIRTKEFHKKLSIGWEDEYNLYRRLWIDLPKKHEIRNYPLLLDLELSTVCNLNCPMCYTTTDSFKKKVNRQFMDMNLFKKVVDEIAGKVFALRLSLRGEATLHPKFIDAISYAKTKGIKEISCLTNGSKLHIDFFKKAAEAGIDWITISIDGLFEDYNMIRRPLKFEETLKKLRDIKKYKETNKRLKPVIKVQSVWPAIRKNPTDYYNTIAPLVDLVSYNPLIDYLSNDIQILHINGLSELKKNVEIVYEKNFVCPQLYQRIVVGSDGSVLMCSNDEDGENIIGNAYQQSIYEIWHGDELNAIRAIHKKSDGFKDIPVCNICYYPRKTIVDETTLVGGRRIFIENYVNRKQALGD